MSRRRSTKKSFARSAASTAMQALRVANQVKGLLNVEFKYHDTTQSNTNIDDNGIEPNIFDPAQGSAQEQRDGDSVRVKRVVIRGSLKYDSDIATGSVVRLMIVKSTRGLLSPGSNMVDPNYRGNVLAPYFHKLYENRKHYKIIYDKTMTVSASNIARSFKINLKLDDKVEFDEGTANSTVNAFYLMAVSDAPNAGADFPQITYVSRIYYVDN